MKATVKWFNDSKGYGFVNAEGDARDIFVHYSTITGEGFKTLEEGQEIELDLVESPRGPLASNVRKLSSRKEGAQC